MFVREVNRMWKEAVVVGVYEVTLSWSLLYKAENTHPQNWQSLGRCLNPGRSVRSRMLRREWYSCQVVETGKKIFMCDTSLGKRALGRLKLGWED